MLKIIGCVLVIFSCSCFGILKGMDCQKRIQALYRLKQLLTALRGEIGYGKTPFIEAFANLAEKETGVFKGFCESISCQLAKLDGRTFALIWTEEVEKQFCSSGLEKSDLQVLGELGHRLGYLDTDMQLSAIDLELSKIDLILQPLEEGVADKQRIYRCAGVFFGITIALVLV